jgi:TRAP-type C4-dicarboxylate transport system permease small subunit
MLEKGCTIPGCNDKGGRVSETGSRTRRPGRAETWLVHANAAVVVAMMIAMVMLVFTNVVCRYGFGFSLIWAEEISQYLMVWVAFLGAGLALRQGRHVAVELLQDRFPERGRVILRGAVAALCLAFLIGVAWLGVEFAWFARDMETPVLNIALAIPYAAVPVGMLLMALHLAFVLRDYAHGRHEVAESIEARIDEEAI